jgi:hypothetical protein
LIAASAERALRPVEPREHVDGDRHELDAEEDDHEVSRGGENHHAARGEQHEYVRLRCVDALSRVVVDREGYRDERCQEEDQVGRPSEAVDRDDAFLGLRAARGKPDHGDRRDQRDDQCADSHRSLMARAVGSPCGPQHEHHGPGHQDEVGCERERQPTRQGHVDRHQRTPGGRLAAR